MITAISIVIGIFLLIWTLQPLLKDKAVYTPLKKEPTLSMEEQLKIDREEFVEECKVLEQEQAKLEAPEPSEERKNGLKVHYAKLLPEDIAVHSELNTGEKNYILTEFHNYTYQESMEMIEIAGNQVEKQRLKRLNRKISRKVTEKYDKSPFNSREAISEDVQNQVWNRDGGKCVKCSSQEKLEFDHIIPVSKGGSNTARNIQLLCEKCNRSKSNNIG